ncbi:MAG: NAD(P) transhydrogenase subunit alpha [Actinomycetia bacterium]|nr:NAD(P) transhydrogenase subunit alpha [Actinomycetes bacterium]MCP4225662.1 NAD(P) transhydrogenase subunit alpha [Actinomycetes bacterium]MCP5033424.1 NAD(P) transhydrogenase subunit alpha [Actinomycetes bacterium]
MVRVVVTTERDEHERRVALTPETVAKLTDRGHEVFIETGSGQRAGFADDDYLASGGVVSNLADVVGSGGLVTMVRGLQPNHADQELWSLLNRSHVLIGLHDPLWRPEDAAKLAATGATVFALELVPRITRAQSMDVLSSMATVVGYEAALTAASRLPKMLPLMMTAAGTIPAARIVVLGAGVAGLQAIATSRRLGAIVDGFDIREAAREQIRSIGARAIEIDLDAGQTEDSGGYAREQTEAIAHRQNELLTPFVAEADAVITAASVPGAVSPELLTTSMVEAMKPGSIIVDLGAERGGNCRLSQADREVVHAGVTILGPTDLASRAPATSSRLFASNVATFIDHLAPDGDLQIDRDDEITAETLVSIGGDVVNPRVLERLGAVRRVSPLDAENEEAAANGRREL